MAHSGLSSCCQVSSDEPMAGVKSLTILLLTTSLATFVLYCPWFHFSVRMMTGVGPAPGVANRPEVTLLYSQILVVNFLLARLVSWLVFFFSNPGTLH